MIEFFAIALVVYLAAGNKERRTAAGRAVRAGGSAGRTAARGTWDRTRPAPRTPSAWWDATPVRRGVRAGGRAVRTGGHLGLAGLLSALVATYAAVRAGAPEWRNTRREQIQQRIQTITDAAPDSEPDSPTTTTDTPEPEVSTPATVTPISTTNPAKEAPAMTTAPADISDLTTHLTELQSFYDELAEGEIWPVIESWAQGSDLFGRHLGDDVHASTDEIASAAQAMVDGREVILDAVEAAIAEAKATMGDAAA
jgi:hypothetical protein